ncbi:McrC family protein [Burkholderia cenocepacia]
MKNKIICVKEYGEVEVPANFILPDGNLSVFSEALGKNYFSVRFKKGRPVFQAGGYVGIVPINSDISLEIIPKVPIANLERILLLGNSVPLRFRNFRRLYSYSKYIPKSIADLLVENFLDSLEMLHEQGMLRLYSHRSEVGLFPRGRLDINRTIRARGAAGMHHVAYSWSERHIDNGPNRLLKHTIDHIAPHVYGSRDRQMRRRFTICRNFFDQVSYDCDQAFWADALVSDPTKIPGTRDAYVPAISLAKLILNGGGISLTESSGPVLMNSLVVNVDEAFEYYVLAALKRKCEEGQTAIYAVLDGNKGGQYGGMKKLLDVSNHPSFINESIDAKPDIVIRARRKNGDEVGIVVDVKYKVANHIADRADINQIIAYGSSYGANCAILLLPAPEPSQRGLKCLGTVGGTVYFQYAMNLNSHDLVTEEDFLWEAILSLVDHEE